MTNETIKNITALFFLVILTTMFYWSGLDTHFILDDISNLSRLELIKEENTWAEFWRFVLEGYAGSLGRPISLLSFALQADAWPHAYLFKLTNLVIHLLNGSLIFILLQSLSRLYGIQNSTAFWLSFFTTALWLLHPMQVSTVLYVVQRMAQLSSLFTLLGLVLYVVGRQAYLHNKPLKAFLFMSLGVGLSGILATLSKENGILLILYVLTIEFTLLHKLPRPHWWLKWSLVFCFAPLLLLILWFITHPNLFIYGYSLRDFSLVERLLTETRILLDYAYQILLPQSERLSVFHDDYVISRSLFNPLSTLFAVAILSSLFLSALLLRKSYPIFAFAVLWFASGHALESTAVPLILYFEHRNYLAMLGILFAVVYALYWALGKMQTHWYYPIWAASMVWFSLILMVSYLQITLWQDQLAQALYWAEQKPHSRFAQSYAAALLLQAKQPEKALLHYQHMQKNFPQDTGNYALWLNLSCHYPQITPPEFSKLMEQFRYHGQSDIGTLKGMNALATHALNKSCAILSREQIIRLFDALLENPDISISDKAYLYILYAQLQAAQKNYTQAIQSIEKGLSLQAKMADYALAHLLKLAYLMQIEDYATALLYIQEIEQKLTNTSYYAYAEHLNKIQSIAQQRLQRNETNELNAE